MTSLLPLGCEMVRRKSSEKAAMLALLKAMTKLASTLSDSDIEALASGEATLTIERRKAIPTLFVNSPRGRTPDASYLKELRESLATVDSTSAGFEMLNRAGLNRVNLEEVARSLDLPLTKQDSTSRLEEKIIEALIGSRLNSQAVRGR